VTRVLAVEPEPRLRALATAATEAVPVPVEVTGGMASALPAADASYDTAVVSFVLRPVPSTHLAEALGWPVSEAEALARQGGFGTRVEDGLITVSPERARAAPRRQLQIGDRRFGVTGCAPDIFLYAPLVRPSLQVEETCPVTGIPIRLMFTPSRVESVEPAGAVLPLPGPQSPLYSCAEAASNGEQIDADACDASLCSQAPLFSSAEAAQGWLDTHPGGRVFPIRQAWDLSPYRNYRDRMSALLDRKD
jgi:hypothetical protein